MTVLDFVLSLRWVVCPWNQLRLKLIQLFYCIEFFVFRENRRILVHLVCTDRWTMYHLCPCDEQLCVCWIARTIAWTMYVFRQCKASLITAVCRILAPRKAIMWVICSRDRFLFSRCKNSANRCRQLACYHAMLLCLFHACPKIIMCRLYSASAVSGMIWPVISCGRGRSLVKPRKHNLSNGLYIPLTWEITYLYHAQGYSDPPDVRHVMRRDLKPVNLIGQHAPQNWCNRTWYMTVTL